MSDHEEWTSYDWDLPQMAQDTASISVPDAEVSQNGFLLNSEFNWASNGGYANGARVDENMRSHGSLANFLPNHGLNHGLVFADNLTNPSADFGAGSPYFAHDSSSNGSPFDPPHAAFLAPSNRGSAPDIDGLSSSNFVGGRTDDTEAEPAYPSDDHPEDSGSLVPDLVDLIKGAKNAPSNDYTLFTSLEHARSFNQSTEALPEDPTIPQTQAEKRAIVKEMCKAMLSLEHATDNEGMLRPFRNQKYSKERIEVCCWQTLEAVIMRQKGGPLLAAYDTSGKADMEKFTFAQRMTRIIECFYRHKTVCKHILDPLYLYNLVDNPTAAERRVESNKLLNRRKSHIMTAGKEALRIGQRRQPVTATTATPKNTRRTVAQKAPRTAPKKTVPRKAPRSTGTKAKKRAISPPKSDSSESSEERDQIFTPTSTPEPTGSEADASPQSLLTPVPCSSSIVVPQAVSYYPQPIVNGEPAYHFNPNIAYAPHNKRYQQTYMSNMQAHHMSVPASYSLSALDFMSSPAPSYYSPGSMTDLRVSSSPLAEATIRRNPVGTPTPTAKATRKRPSITITGDMGQAPEKRRR